AALGRADTFVATWQRHLLDPGGSYKEGVQYGAWSMHHLSAYFFARKRYDGVDFSRDPAIRGIEQWLSHELLPEPGAFLNNLNDTAYLNHPLSRHSSYVDWAMTAWSSGLAAWLWERILGEYGFDWGLNVDRAATVLWWRPLAPQSPAATVPRAVLWRDRGLYYYRTGWPAGGGSDDVVFSFYSGRFHGGHAQQDQNSFTLYAFGARFAADNGFDAVNWESDAHNMVFIDGAGQHYAGTTWGTDGRIAAHILGGYAEYLFGDATAAYTTHSPFNDPGVPFPDDDWSAGYRNANPVQYAHRRWIVVREGATPPYFVLLDDIRKDDAMRVYDWRMHTELTHAVDVAASSILLTAANGAALALDVLAAAGSTPSVRTETFVNPSSDPDTRVVVLSETATAGRFALVMRPAGAGAAEPSITRVSAPWGGAEILAWPSGPVDVVIANAGRDTAVVTGPAWIATDARLAQLRFTGGALARGVLIDATSCDAGAIPLLRSGGEPVSVVLDGRTIHVGGEDAVFTVYAPEATAVHVDGAPVPFTRDGNFVQRGPGTPEKTPARLGVTAYPVPFNAGVTVALYSPGPARADVIVYDVRGRPLRRLWSGTLVTGRTLVRWDGRDGRGHDVPSGVYFVRATAADRNEVIKIVRVR
ncbi:MAG TPA: heparinase II/III family protein, partial [Candidatus Krumholzibacteria bacterium]|nr:heparinase II/III family protein [Candidatus Krumholzibacteria bacterium]